MSLLIHNVTIFTNNDANEMLRGQAVAIEGSRIVAIGPEGSLKEQYRDGEWLDGSGRLLMPGFTNAHMHFYGMYARGITLNQTPNNFHEILQYLWWALDKVLDLDAVYYSALIPAVTSVRKGVTSIIDHHASPNACLGSLDKIEAAMTQLGLRGLLCYEVSDRDGKAIRDKGIEENIRYIKKCQAAKASNPDHLFDGMMGLHASFTLDDDSLTMAVSQAAAVNRGCHIHMLEDFCDETFTREKYGQPVVERLADFGVLGPQSIAAHAIFLDDASRQRLVDSEASIVHQAQSNMNNAVGRADVFKLLANGALVGIGTDGMTPDLRRESMTGYLLHKHHVSDNNVGWGEFEQMTMKNNPRIFAKLTGQSVGQVTEGFLADLILVDYYPPTGFEGGNFWGHYLFGLVDADVDTTIINGKVIMRNKVIAGIDEPAIAREAQVVGAGVWQRYAAQAKA